MALKEGQETGNVAAQVAESPHYRPALHHFLIRRLRNAEDAQDLAQETYLRFYQLSNREAIERPRDYLFRIALNLVYEFRLKRARDQVTYDSEMADALSEQTADAASADPAEAIATAEQLNRLLAQIPSTYRKVFLMHKRDGLSCREIAQALRITARSAEIYLARATAYARNARWT